jgi:tetratricopeptide (TPR) repeat protein
MVDYKTLRQQSPDDSYLCVLESGGRALAHGGEMGLFRHLVSIFFLLAVWNCANAQSSQSPGTPYFEKAKEYFDTSNYELAELLFREGMQWDPNSSLGMFYLAQTIAALRPNDFEALQLFRKVHSLAPKSPQGVEAFIQINKLEKKLAAVKKARDAEVSGFMWLSKSCFQKNTSRQGWFSGRLCICFGGYRQGTDLASDSISFNALYTGPNKRVNRTTWMISTSGTAKNFEYEGRKIYINIAEGPGSIGKGSFLEIDNVDRIVDASIDGLLNQMPRVWLDFEEKQLMTEDGRMTKECKK